VNFVHDHLLTALVFLPLVGASIALAFPRGEHTGVRGFAMAVSLADLALAVTAWARFEPQAGLQFVESAAWVPAFGIRYMVGLDGIALLMVLLTTFMAPLVVLSTYSSIATRTREFMVCLLLLQTCMLGGFVATDMFLFFTFWECTLIPAYFLIGIWGGRRRVHAALKFFLYTITGSLLMFVAIMYTVWSVADAGGMTFSWPEVAERLSHTELGDVEIWLFLAFALAFAIKVPLFPLHSWLPDAYAEAPTPATVILSGVLAKLGAFGFLRYALWLFPHTAAAFLPTLGILAVIGIIYGALVATVQFDAKRLIAYASLSHMGFIMLGIVAMTVTGLSGSALQMVNHGVATGALFLLVGVIYERRRTREMADLGGIAQVMPLYAATFVWLALSTMGLPGLAGFVGEFLILLGTFSSEGLAVSSTTGDVARAAIILAAAVVVLAIGILAANVARHGSKGVLGGSSKLLALAVATCLLLGLLAPPMGPLGGGLLVQPLLQVADSQLPFHEIYGLLAMVALLGIVLSAVYMLQAIQRIFFGPIRHPENEHLLDLSVRECCLFAPFVVLTVVIGMHPQPFLNIVQPTAEQYTRQFRLRAGMPPEQAHPLVGRADARLDAADPQVPLPAVRRGLPPTGNPLQELVAPRRQPHLRAPGRNQ
jgi:NADH-quinone oxidoreductase subunit M